MNDDMKKFCTGITNKLHVAEDHLNITVYDVPIQQDVLHC